MLRAVLIAATGVHASRVDVAVTPSRAAGSYTPRHML